MTWSPPAPTGSLELVSSQSPPIQTGFKSVIQNIPCANGGEAISPQTDFEFYIRPSPLAFIKPNSMYLRALVVIDGNPAIWSFAGQSGYGNAGTGDLRNPSPAASIIDQLSVIFPNGQEMQYSKYDIFEWGITHSHMLSKEYVNTDLRVLEACNTVRLCSQVNPPLSSRSAYVAIPLNIPVFNSKNGFPLCFLNAPITIRMRSNTVAKGLFSTVNPISSYTLSEMSLIYEEIRVSDVYKQQLMSLPSPYSIFVNDRRFLGVSDGSMSSRANFGVGLSSLKGVVWLDILPLPTSGDYKSSRVLGLNRWSLYVDNRRINQFEIDNYPVCFAELQRALQSIFDLNRTSNLYELNTSTESSLNSTYLFGQFAAGLSTAVFNSDSLTMSGIPCSEVAVEIERGNSNPIKWGHFNGSGPGALNHIWAFHDTLVLVSPNGDVEIRR